MCSWGDTVLHKGGAGQILKIGVRVRVRVRVRDRVRGAGGRGRYRGVAVPRPL